MTPSLLVQALLAIAVGAAWLRLLVAHRRASGHARAWRLLVLLSLQPALAVVLYLTLFPPERPLAAWTLTVLTEGAGRSDLPPPAEGGRVVALPEADAPDGAVRVPDLATALRRYPGTTHVRVVGAGLVARDRDAARSVPIVFSPPPLLRGIVRLQAPPILAPGATFPVEGEVQGVVGGRVELLDPTGQRIDAMPLPRTGAFALQGVAFAEGAARFSLRVIDAQGAQVDVAPLQVWTDAAHPPRVLLLAGAPNAETRALRRWLEASGASVRARIALGGGVALGDVSLSEQALAEADLLVVDAQAWSGLGEGARARVRGAVEAGLGLLVRADAPLAGSALGALRAPGFTIEAGPGTQAWSMPPARLADEAAVRALWGVGSRDAPFDPAVVREPVPALLRRAWRVRGDHALPLTPTATPPVGWWRPQGRGRIGFWTLLDSYQLVQHGRADLYGELWGPPVATLARAQAQLRPVVEPGAQVGTRIVVCGLQAGAVIEAPDGARMQPVLDPATGAHRCAGVWPRVAGWHRVRAGTDVTPFHVSGADAHRGLRLAALREATLRYAGASVPRAAGPPVRAPGPAWPWFLGWLLLAACAWWFERSRLGRWNADAGQDVPGRLR